MEGSLSTQLDALSKLAASFSRAYPALAPRLAERSSDPDVERILDAFAYLTERIHRLLDASSPAAAQSLADLLAPELSRPLPAATIVEFEPPRGGRISIPPGAEVESVPIDGTRCRFCAWSAFDVVPWSVEDAHVTWLPTEGQSLELTLRSTTAHASSEALLASLFPLRVHLGGDWNVALSLLLLLRCHLTSIDLRIGGEGGKSYALGRSLRPWGLSESEALLPPEPFEHPGLRLVREYFTLPAKFAFVELGTHLPAIEAFAAESFPVDRVELRLRFDAPIPSALHPTRENVRLNCVPVANVFETTTDPIRPSLERPEQVLRPSGLSVGHGETYSVSRVFARVVGLPGIAPIASFSDFEAKAPSALDDVFYVARTCPSSLNSGSDVQLSLGSPAGSPPAPEIEYLSVEIRASNGPLANGLGIGDVRFSTDGPARSMAVRNISAVTPHHAPAAGDELRWRTLAVVTLSALPLDSAGTLRTLLHVLNLRPLGDASSASAHAQKLSAIRDVRLEEGRAARRSSRGDGSRAVVLGHDVRVDLGLAGFEGEGDALVFASVLAGLFGHEASIGAFARTSVHIVETGRIFEFPAAEGDRVLDPSAESGSNHVP